jgi:predicted nucleic acid-binding protein
MAWYIDTSALVKLVSTEAETPALHDWVTTNAPELVSSDLLRTELLRAVRRSGAAHDLDVDDGLAAIDMLPATGAVFDAAGTLEPLELRSLDAVHLATAIDIRDDCDGFITYDDRLAAAARHHGLDVLAPS